MLLQSAVEIGFAVDCADEIDELWQALKYDSALVIRNGCATDFADSFGCERKNDRKQALFRGWSGVGFQCGLQQGR